MSFLQPALLLALPMVVLPMVIHLINQRRYQTMPWGAMQFLLTATRDSRGFARLRQWLILLLRMLVIGALVLAVSRPLASGRFSLSGRADTTIILLDRSPSMEQQVGGVSKLTAARQQLAQALRGGWLGTMDPDRPPHGRAAGDRIARRPAGDAGIPGPPVPRPTCRPLLQAARDYIDANQTGRTEIWIGSDLRANDWRIESGQWRDLRSGFLKFAQSIRFHLLAFPQTAPENLAVRVSGLSKISTGDDAGLAISLSFTREDFLAQDETSAQGAKKADRPVTLPVQLEVEGARSELTVEMSGAHYALQDCRIALPGRQGRGWGRVTIPRRCESGRQRILFCLRRSPSTTHSRGR